MQAIPNFGELGRQSLDRERGREPDQPIVTNDMTTDDVIEDINQIEDQGI